MTVGTGGSSGLAMIDPIVADDETVVGPRTSFVRDRGTGARL